MHLSGQSSRCSVYEAFPILYLLELVLISVFARELRQPTSRRLINPPIEIPVRNAFDQCVIGPQLAEARVLTVELQEIERPTDRFMCGGDVHGDDIWAITLQILDHHVDGKRFVADRESLLFCVALLEIEDS